MYEGSWKQHKRLCITVTAQVVAGMHWKHMLIRSRNTNGNASQRTNCYLIAEKYLRLRIFFKPYMRNGDGYHPKKNQNK